MRILAIETSCDETAAAVVDDGITEIAEVLATSKDFHEKTGGVVPEVAARKQLEYIAPVIEQVQEKLGGTFNSIDAIAVTIGPGLLGSLLIGVEAAKAVALALDKPLIPVNHLVGHIYANFIRTEANAHATDKAFPAIVLVVSGGHTDLVLMRAHGDLEYIGGTLDDAAGEAFDKVARLLGISNYLGGVALSKKASEAVSLTMKDSLPRPKIHDADFDFSFSGLKSAVKRIVDIQGLNNLNIEDFSHEFENAIVEVLVKKTILAAKKYNCKNILLGGGVSANNRLRESLKMETLKSGIDVYFPPLRLCGDNAIYIASAAYFNQKMYRPCDFDQIQANPGLIITS